MKKQKSIPHRVDAVVIRFNNQCLFCKSRRCYFRIHTDGKDFNHVACQQHSRTLEKYADRILGARMRHHLTSSAVISRAV